MTPRRRWTAAVAAVVLASCGGSNGSDDAEPAAATSAVSTAAPDFVTNVRRAIDAVESELGGPQEFFEVTSTGPITNVFIAVDDGTAAIAYLYREGLLEPPAPKQTGAAGLTFVAEDVRFDESTVLSGVQLELPDTTIDGLSVYGDGVGATYVLAASSDAGGALDIVVTETGQIVSVDPV